MIVPGVVRVRAPLPYPDPDHINVYFLLEEDGAILVDPGMIGGEELVDRAVARAGVSVDRVLLTHAHPDHWGLARRYAPSVLAHRHAEVQMRFHDDPHRLLRTALPGRTISPELLVAMTHYLPTVLDVPDVCVVADGDRLGGWEVIATPGHAAEHICLYRAYDGVLIAGDHLLPDATPHLHLSPEADDPVEDYVRSLQRTAAMDISLVLPAHGEPFRGAARRAAALIAHHDTRLARLARWVADGLDVPAIVAAEFPRVHGEQDLAMAEMEVQAHLAHLRRARRRVERAQSAAPAAGAR